jgi:hypothetical protein
LRIRLGETPNRRRNCFESWYSSPIPTLAATDFIVNAKGLVWFPRFTLRTYPSGYAGGKVPGGPVKKLFQLCFLIDNLDLSFILVAN